MPNTRVYHRSFSGGEVSPEMYGRLDDNKFQTGAALVKNFIVLPQGPLVNRPGFELVREVKDSSKKVRLIPFTFNTTQTMIIEMGNYYARFHTNGATLTQGTPAPIFAGAVVTFTQATATVTMTIATPAVITWTGHTLANGDRVRFTTTGALPTGLAINTDYYVVNSLTNTFQVAATSGGSPIATSGTQSGVHTAYGKPVTVNYTSHGFANGTEVAFQTTGSLPTRLTANTTYYVVNAQTNSFQVAETSGGDGIIATSSGTATTTVYRSYAQGSFVQDNGSVFYCISRAINVPTGNAAYWYMQPSSGVYEIPTQYAEADLFDIHYVQSADVLTLVHPSYAPRELRRYGATNWQMASINFGANLSAPTGLTLTMPATPAVTTPINYTYVVTALSSDEINESIASTPATVSNNLLQQGRYTTISWNAVSGASRYNIYRLVGGIYGFIGSTTSTTIVDDNIAADTGIVPPTYESVFGSANNYPGAVSYYEQRRIFAGTNNEPQRLWMTKSGTESDMSYGIPLSDADRISFRVAAREANTIRHIVPLTQLILLTSAAEWRVTSVNSDAITPTSISVRPQSYVGASNVQPIIINNSLVYCAARGGHVRELGYSWQSNGFITGDLSIRATHLFDSYDLSDMCYAKAPHPVLWFVSTTGKLLGLTYIPEQQIGSWHQHDTDGVFESCACVQEGTEDRLYAVVKRTINGSVKRFVERMATRDMDMLEDCVHMDCALTYDGNNTAATTVTITQFSGTDWDKSSVLTITASSAIFQYPATTDVNDCIVMTDSSGNKYRLKISSTVSTTVARAIIDNQLPASLRSVATATWAFARDSISGLSHLEGKTVAILADGAVMAQRTVSSGAITLDRASTLVHIGLPYVSDLQTLPVMLNIDGYGQGRYKNVNKAWVRVERSAGLFVGPDSDSLVEAKMRTDEPMGSPPNLKSEEILVVMNPSWAQTGQIVIRQSDPMPLCIISMTAEVAIGG